MTHQDVAVENHNFDKQIIKLNGSKWVISAAMRNYQRVCFFFRIDMYDFQDLWHPFNFHGFLLGGNRTSRRFGPRLVLGRLANESLIIREGHIAGGDAIASHHRNPGVSNLWVDVDSISLYLSIPLSLYPFIYLSNIYLSVYLSVCLSAYLSVDLSICLSVYLLLILLLLTLL